MPDIDAAPFIAIAMPRGHRKKFGKHARVNIGATVDKGTDKQLTSWHGKKLSRGLCLDQLVSFGRKRKFKILLPKK